MAPTISTYDFTRSIEDTLMKETSIKCMVHVNSTRSQVTVFLPHQQTDLEKENLPFLNHRLPPVFDGYEKRWPVLQVPKKLLESEAEGPETQLPLLAQFKYVKFAKLVNSSKFRWELSYRREAKSYERLKHDPGQSSYIETPLSTLDISHQTELLIISDLPTNNEVDKMNFSTQLRTDQCLVYLKLNLKSYIVKEGRTVFRKAFGDRSKRYPSQIMSCLHHLTLYVVYPKKKGEMEAKWKPLDSMDIHEFAGAVWEYLKDYRPLRVSFKLEEIKKVEKEILGLPETVEEKGNRLSEAEMRAEKDLDKRQEDLERREQALAMSQNELTMRFNEVGSGFQSMFIFSLLTAKYH